MGSFLAAGEKYHPQFTYAPNSTILRDFGGGTCERLVDNIRTAYYENTGEIVCHRLSFGGNPQINCIEQFGTAAIGPLTVDYSKIGACVDFSTNQAMCYSYAHNAGVGMQMGLGLGLTKSVSVVCPNSFDDIDGDGYSVCFPSATFLFFSIWPQLCVEYNSIDSATAKYESAGYSLTIGDG